MGIIKSAFFASCSSSSSANITVELDSIFASVKHRECGFNRAWQDEPPWLLFTTEYSVKLESSFKFYAYAILLMIFICDHPV